MTEGFRVLVCGSRTFANGPLIGTMLSGVSEGSTVIHGAAKGADTHAAVWAEKLGFDIEAYPADWKKYGKRAGFLRNERMLVEGKPDVVMAFVDKPLTDSIGTKMMVRLAQEANLPVYVVEFIAPRMKLEPTAATIIGADLRLM